jgi:hypothetical protein
VQSIPSELKQNVKALYLQENLLTEGSFSSILQIVGPHFPNLEILNGKFTEKYAIRSKFLTIKVHRMGYFIPMRCSQSSRVACN